MTMFKRLVAAGSLATAILTSGVVPVAAQTVIGGETECTTTKVITRTYFGQYYVEVTTFETTCVTVLDV